MTVVSTDSTDKVKYKKIIAHLKNQDKGLSDLVESIFSLVCSDLPDEKVDSDIAKCVVMMNKLFQYSRFAKESTVDHALENRCLFEVTKKVWELSSHYPHARKSCWTSITNKIGEYYLYELRAYQKAESYFQRALDMANFDCNEQFHYDRARALSNLGYLVWNNGHYLVARNYLSEAKNIYQTMHKDSLEVVFCLNCLGLVDKTEEKFDQAIINYLEALNILQRIDPKIEHLHYAMVYHNLGTCQRLIGKYVDAEENLKKAYAVNINAFKTEERIEIPGNLHEIGNVYFACGDYQEAKNCYQHSLEVRKKCLKDKNHLDLAASYNSLAQIALIEGNEDEAEKLFSLEKSIYQKSMID